MHVHDGGPRLARIRPRRADFLGGVIGGWGCCSRVTSAPVRAAVMIKGVMLGLLRGCAPCRADISAGTTQGAGEAADHHQVRPGRRPPRAVPMPAGITLRASTCHLARGLAHVDDAAFPPRVVTGVDRRREL